MSRRRPRKGEGPPRDLSGTYLDINYGTKGTRSRLTVVHRESDRGSDRARNRFRTRSRAHARARARDCDSDLDSDDGMHFMEAYMATPPPNTETPEGDGYEAGTPATAEPSWCRSSSHESSRSTEIAMATASGAPVLSPVAVDTAPGTLARRRRRGRPARGRSFRKAGSLRLLEAMVQPKSGERDACIQGNPNSNSDKELLLDAVDSRDESTKEEVKCEDDDDAFSTEFEYGLGASDSSGAYESSSSSEDEEDDDSVELNRYRSFMRSLSPKILHVSPGMKAFQHELDNSDNEPPVSSLPQQNMVHKSRGVRIMICAFVFALVIIIIAIALPLSLLLLRKNGNDNPIYAVPLEDNAVNKNEHHFQPRPMVDVDPEQVAVELLSAVTSVDTLLPSEATLRNIQSPQRLAMKWLIAKDLWFGAYMHDGPEESQHVKFEETEMIPGILERFAMATLYFATHGESWKDDVNWLSVYHVCEWYGVTCDGTKTVTKLQLTDNNMSGELPVELGGKALKGLLLLDLSSNKLTGTVPVGGVGLLKKVIHVNMADNRLEGTLPEDIGEMVSLEKLDLSNNLVEGTIPASVGHLGNLLHLRLSNNRLGGDLRSIVETLKAEQLEVLSLDNNRLDGMFPPSIRQLQSMVVCKLANNFLTGSIPEEIGQLHNLLELDLSQNQLEGGIPSSIADLKKLQHLILSNNYIAGNVPRDLSGLADLQNLSLDGNALVGGIPPWIDNLASLKTLYLHKNSFQGEVPRELGFLKRLTQLTLERNDFVGTVPALLCDLHLRLFSADCGGDDPKLSCACCTECMS